MRVEDIDENANAVLPVSQRRFSFDVMDNNGDAEQT